MRRLLNLLLMIALPLLCFSQGGPGALFTKGNALYAKGQYAAAFQTYKQIVNEGYQSAAVYFNMGNASYKTGDVPSALLYYEKAHKLAPGDDEINFNIRFVNLKTTDKIEDTSEFFLTKWWDSFILSFSTKGLAIASVVLFLLASAMLILYFFANSVLLKMTSFYVSISLFFCGTIAIFIAAKQVNYFEANPQAIIFSNSVTVKSAPAIKSNNLFVIHEGTKVNVLGNSNGWIKVKIGNGNVGWIKAGDAKEI